MANNEIMTPENVAKIKAWCWVIGIIAVAILAVIIFCHVVYWLIWIGAATVVVLAIVICVLIAKTVNKIKNDDGGD